MLLNIYFDTFNSYGIDRWQPSKWDSLMGYKTPGQPIEKKQLQQVSSGQTKPTRPRVMRSRFMG
ncbi:hypothetical protein [Holospora undulata]|uniref:Uncharacterized protein n=1 Tax=Holospora undulata HU1 TaxID=1321371 RepID=A0A061JGP8_9PROT|nr:hypothetical protein [Holospora undulata]ETZ04437.1 hypothetical protein K737_301148 [Holospora undulata HU1]